jgi:hypothetical protein
MDDGLKDLELREGEKQQLHLRASADSKQRARKRAKHKPAKRSVCQSSVTGQTRALFTVFRSYLTRTRLCAQPAWGTTVTVAFEAAGRSRSWRSERCRAEGNARSTPAGTRALRLKPRTYHHNSSSLRLAGAPARRTRRANGRNAAATNAVLRDGTIAGRTRTLTNTVKSTMADKHSTIVDDKPTSARLCAPGPQVGTPRAHTGTHKRVHTIRLRSPITPASINSCHQSYHAL